MKSGLFLEASGDFALAILKSPRTPGASFVRAFAPGLLSSASQARRSRLRWSAIRPSTREGESRRRLPDRAFYEERLRALARVFEPSRELRGAPARLPQAFRRGPGRAVRPSGPAVARIANTRWSRGCSGTSPPPIGRRSPSRPGPARAPAGAAEGAAPSALPLPDPVRESSRRGSRPSGPGAGRRPRDCSGRPSRAGRGRGGARRARPFARGGGEIRPASAAVSTGLSRDPSLAEPGRPPSGSGAPSSTRAATRLEGADPTSASTSFLRGSSRRRRPRRGRVALLARDPGRAIRVRRRPAPPRRDRRARPRRPATPGPRPCRPPVPSRTRPR